MVFEIRRWLIKKLIGRMPVMANMTICEPIVFHPYIFLQKGMIFGNLFCSQED